MKSARVTGKSVCSVEVNGSTPSASWRRATMIAKHSESSPDSERGRSSDRGANFLFCSWPTCLNCDRTSDLTLIALTSPWHEKLRIGCNAAVPNSDDIDQLGQYRGARDLRADSSAPMHGSRLAVDDHRKNLRVAELERLDQQCEPGANFTQAGRFDRHRAGVARARDLQSGFLFKCPAKRFEVAAQSRGIEVSKQALDFEPIRHGAAQRRMPLWFWARE